jgi:hypothetical protein
MLFNILGHTQTSNQPSGSRLYVENADILIIRQETKLVWCQENIIEMQEMYESSHFVFVLSLLHFAPLLSIHFPRATIMWGG